MHCPSCGQQQVSNETKFCSRCGLPLGLVSEVVANGGFLPQLAQLQHKKPFFNKKNGVVFGAFFFFIAIFLTCFFAILDAPEGLVAMCALTGFFGAIMISVASLIFLPSSKSQFRQLPLQPTAQGLYGNRSAALPPQQSVPVDAYRTPGMGAWRDTRDLEPTSVTEGTTRLLNEEETR